MGHVIIRVAADGSAGSRRALAWALREAKLRDGAVELISAYQGTSASELERARAAAEEAVHTTMDGVVNPRHAGTTVSWHVEAGDPADVLVRESEHSELLVMGSHGVAGMRHAALGSVTDMCARMASCPVVIIPPALTLAPSREELVRSAPRE